MDTADTTGTRADTCFARLERRRPHGNCCWSRPTMKTMADTSKSRPPLGRSRWLLVVSGQGDMDTASCAVAVVDTCKTMPTPAIQIHGVGGPRAMASFLARSIARGRRHTAARGESRRRRTRSSGRRCRASRASRSLRSRKTDSLYRSPPAAISCSPPTEPRAHATSSASPPRDRARVKDRASEREVKPWHERGRA